MASAASPAGPGPAAPTSRVALAFALMLLLTLVVYAPAWWPADGELFGMDYDGLHVHRLGYAQAQLRRGVLPAWSPREGLGAPFWSNPHSFTFSPVRWPLLLLDRDRHAFPAAVVLAALGAASACFALARRLGVGPVGAAAAGWTFACSGFYAARVLAGHLPLLEAYPALPLLLWLVDRAAAGEEGEGPPAPRHLALAVGAAAVALAGHPQLPAYSLALAAAFAAWRARTRRARTRTILSLGLGVAACAATLVPTALLAARSTRSLPHLAAPGNDVALGWANAPLAFAPWSVGFASPHPFAERAPACSLPVQVFYDSVCYVGLLPLAAVLVGAAGLALRRRLPPDRRWWFVAGAAALALVLALDGPWRDGAGGRVLFRSPSRWLYVTGLGLSLGLGAFLERARSLRPALVVLLLALHVVDLGAYSRTFLKVVPTPSLVLTEDLARAAGDGRVGVPLEARGRHLVDDVGQFDSLLLAVPYQALAAVSGRPAGENVQDVAGNRLPERALRWAGVRVVVGSFDRPFVRQVQDPSPRAAFFARGRVERAPLPEARRRVASDAHDLLGAVVLSPPPGAPTPDEAPPSPTAAGPPPRRLAVHRPRPDVVVVPLDAPEAGAVRLVEAWDPGWAATVDGRPAPVLVADAGLVGVEVPAGAREVRLEFSTPGAAWGAIGSALAVFALAAHVRRCRDAR